LRRAAAGCGASRLSIKIESDGSPEERGEPEEEGALDEDYMMRSL